MIKLEQKLSQGSAPYLVQNSDDSLLRLAAFEQIKRLNQIRDHLTSADLAAGFIYQDERIPLVNPQRGIFKPQRMSRLLSIRTVFPRRGAKVWYDDQRDIHKQIYEGDSLVDYAFMGDNPESAENRWLREAMEDRVPIIYFLGVAPGFYKAIFPVFIAEWDAPNLCAKVAFSQPGQFQARMPETAVDRRYALREVKQRLHQASFREAVIAAYSGRCAISGIPEPLLLDAAHIVEDGNEELGQPVVQNGIPLSKIHHAAFDAHLLGISPDFRIHVAERLMIQKDGPLLESLKHLQNQILVLPARVRDRPDRDRLAHRFEQFKGAT